LQSGVDAARRFELESAGAGSGYSRAVYLVARQQIARQLGFFCRFTDRVLPLLPVAQMLSRAVIGLQPGKGEGRRLDDKPSQL
jgi:hypothetical protein